MRSYPTDSPEAAARLVAMALVADGHYATAEIRTLDRLHAPARLGLAPEAFELVMDHFCEDLLLASHGEWMGSAAIDSATCRHPQMGEPHPPVVLHRRRETDLHDSQRGLGVHAGTRRKRTDWPGRSRAGGLRSASHIDAVVRPIRYQPPGDDDGYTQV